MASTIAKRLQNELGLIKKKGLPPGVIRAEPCDPNDLSKWVGEIEGPKGTPYEGGIFTLKLFFKQGEYPQKPPQVLMETRTFHCNISPSGGYICLSLLTAGVPDGWRPFVQIPVILEAIRELLSLPNPNDSLIKSTGEMYLNNREKYDQVAREWTLKYATRS